MKLINSSDIITQELLIDSKEYTNHEGFEKDYQVLTCLLRIHKPATIFEIGTNTGEGVIVMKAALPGAKIYSLDLDHETMLKNPSEYPLEANGDDRVGSAAISANVDYIQLRGDSIEFFYDKYFPIDAWFIDGAHDYKHVYVEAIDAMMSKPKLIVFHDADMHPVYDAIQDAFSYQNDYDLFRVEDTRILYALRK